MLREAKRLRSRRTSNVAPKGCSTQIGKPERVVHSRGAALIQKTSVLVSNFSDRQNLRVSAELLVIAVGDILSDINAFK
jgi:hypothetical protein